MRPLAMTPVSVTLLSLSVVALLVASVHTSNTGRGCYDMMCASVVSKCMLTKACMCEISRDPSECSCCHTCTQCLGNDYQRCCPCLGLCEPSSISPLSQESQVGDIKDPFISLFEALTAAPDQHNKWTHYTFPIDATLQQLGRRANVGTIKYEVVPPPDESPSSPAVASTGGGVTINCTVMYVSQCISVTKCQDYCNQWGAASYRYFFDGCCECVGHTCLNYGINESRCSECSTPDDDREADNEEFTNEVDGKKP